MLAWGWVFTFTTPTFPIRPVIRAVIGGALNPTLATLRQPHTPEPSTGPDHIHHHNHYTDAAQPDQLAAPHPTLLFFLFTTPRHMTKTGEHTKLCNLVTAPKSPHSLQYHHGYNWMYSSVAVFMFTSCWWELFFLSKIFLFLKIDRYNSRLANGVRRHQCHVRHLIGAAQLLSL